MYSSWLGSFLKHRDALHQKSLAIQYARWYESTFGFFSSMTQISTHGLFHYPYAVVRPYKLPGRSDIIISHALSHVSKLVPPGCVREKQKGVFNVTTKSALDYTRESRKEYIEAVSVVFAPRVLRVEAATVVLIIQSYQHNSDSGVTL